MIGSGIVNLPFGSRSRILSQVAGREGKKMLKARDRTAVRSVCSRDDIRIRHAILQFVTGHPYGELPPPVVMPELVDARRERRAAVTH
jgi:hypothetical protein